ncbi:unnamed protein product, partial [Acidithrix sp. C25]
VATAPKSSLLTKSLINLTNLGSATYEQKDVHAHGQPLVARRDSLKPH